MLKAVLLAARLEPIGGSQMKSDPEDEPGVYLLYAFIMFVGIIAAAVIAAGILVHVNL